MRSLLPANSQAGQRIASSRRPLILVCGISQRTGRRYIGIDINTEYLELSLNHPQRLAAATLDFEEPA